MAKTGVFYGAHQCVQWRSPVSSMVLNFLKNEKNYIIDYNNMSIEKSMENAVSINEYFCEIEATLGSLIMSKDTKDFIPRTHTHRRSKIIGV